MPSQPLIESVTALSSTELMVTWRSPDEVIDEFTLYANGIRKEVTSSSNALQLVLGGLNPFELVAVQVSASNQAGEGPLSEAVQQRTNQDRMYFLIQAPLFHTSPFDLEGPGVVSCTNAWVSSTANELVVSWEEPDRPNGIITGYYLELHEFQTTGAAIATRQLMDNSTSTTFSGLMLGQHCSIYSESLNMIKMICCA